MTTIQRVTFHKHNIKQAYMIDTIAFQSLTCSKAFRVL